MDRHVGLACREYTAVVFNEALYCLGRVNNLVHTDRTFIVISCGRSWSSVKQVSTFRFHSLIPGNVRVTYCEISPSRIVNRFSNILGPRKVWLLMITEPDKD